MAGVLAGMQAMIDPAVLTQSLVVAGIDTAVLIGLGDAPGLVVGGYLQRAPGASMLPASVQAFGGFALASYGSSILGAMIAKRIHGSGGGLFGYGLF